MKVLQAVRYTPAGGIETYTRALFAELERQGHENVVVFEGPRLPGVEAPSRALYQVRGLEDKGGDHEREAADLITAIVSRHRPDVALLHTPATPLIAGRLRQLLPTVYFAHNYSAFCPSGARLFQTTDSVCELRGVPDMRCLVNAYTKRCNTRRPTRLLRSYRRAFSARTVAREADELVCDSAFVLREHRENGILTPGHVLPSPVTLAGTPSRGEERSPLVLFVGRVTPQKGLRYLLEAMPSVSSRARLVVIGDGYDLDRMIRLSRELDLSARVEFRGTLDPSSLRDLYLRASVLAVPSVWPEPWGMVGPEAMAHGLPVVAFRVGGIPEWLADGETGFLVGPKDTKGLADRIQQLLDEPETARRFGERARAVATERFGVARHVAGLVAVLRSAIARRTAESAARYEPRSSTSASL